MTPDERRYRIKALAQQDQAEAALRNSRTILYRIAAKGPLARHRQGELFLLHACLQHVLGRMELEDADAEHGYPGEENEE